MFMNYEKTVATLRAYSAELTVGIVAPHTEEQRSALQAAHKVLQFTGYRSVLGVVATPATKSDRYMPEACDIEEDIDVFLETIDGEGYAAAM